MTRRKRGPASCAAGSAARAQRPRLRPNEAPATIAREQSPPAADPASTSAAPAPSEPKRSWLQRLRSGLSRSSSNIARGLTDIFTKRKLDAASLDDLEDILIQADLGLSAATRIREAVARGRYEQGISADEVKRVLAAEVERALTPSPGRSPSTRAESRS